MPLLVRFAPEFLNPHNLSCSMRAALSRFAHWCAIGLLMCAAQIALAQGATPPMDSSGPEASSASAAPIEKPEVAHPATVGAVRPTVKIVKGSKYDVSRIGERAIGNGLNLYSIEKERALGRQLAQEVESQSRLVSDPVITEYVNRVGQSIVRNSDARVPFTIKVIDDDEINAFALPGGYFYVDSGLILAADSEAELAGVMAHEIAHVAARHATKNATKAQLWNLASIPLIFVGGPVGYAVRQVAGLAVPMSYMKFSRDAEREADLLGLEYDYAAGYDPQSFVHFFEKLETGEKQKKPNWIAKAFATHPMNSDRIRRAQKEIQNLLPPKSEYIVDTSEFQEMKARMANIDHARSPDGGGMPTLRRRGPDDKGNGGPTLRRHT